MIIESEMSLLNILPNLLGSVRAILLLVFENIDIHGKEISDSVIGISNF